MAVAGSYLYKAGDVGQCVYFISYGSVSIDLQADRSMLDSRGITSMQILLHKQEAHGEIHVAGDHFGEFCVVSSSGLRADSAKVLSGTEVYSLSKTDIWSIFQYLTVEQRRSFIFELMTRVGERHHIVHTLSETTEPSNHDDTSIKNLYRMAFEVMTEIVNELNDDPTDGDNKNSAVRKMIHDTSNYHAFTQRDLIDLFVGKSTDESFHMSFSASSMQARLEKAKQAKSHFRALVQKRGGLAGMVRHLNKPEGPPQDGSVKGDKTPSDQEKHRRGNSPKSPQHPGTNNFELLPPSQNQTGEGTSGNFLAEMSPACAEDEEEKGSESSEGSDSDSDSGQESHTIAKAARRFMHEGKTSASFKVQKELHSSLGSRMNDKRTTPTKSDIHAIRAAEAVVLPPAKEATTEAPTGERRRRRSVDVRLESRSSQHDAQLIANVVSIARTREVKLQRGNSKGGSLSMH